LTALAENRAHARTYCGVNMDLYIWMPGVFLLGLVTLGLMFAFIKACERV
jgi:hypothetical protein